MAVKNKLTALAFSKLQAEEKDRLVSDGGSLYVSIRAKRLGGHKSFRICYRIGGKQQWLSLKATSLADARQERDKLQELVKQGIDPAIERRLEVERTRQAQLAEQAELVRQKALITVRDLFERWMEIGLLDRKEDGRVEIRRMFEKDVLPILGEINVIDVRKGHVTEVTDILLKRGVPRMAKLIFALMRQMFRFAVERDILDADPSAAIKKAKIGGRDTERERVLSQEEIRLLHQQMPNANFLLTTEAAIWIMLSTCCRVGEISKARWEHVDFEQREWTIPSENSKSGKPHTVYLSDFAITQFKVLAQFQSSEWLLTPT